jgi:DNA-binding SARP family transcriptional activator
VEAVEYRILGPLEVIDDGQPISLGPAKQRTLLAVLVTRANEAVSTDELVDALWGSEPPASAPNAIQVHISHLRRTLEAGDGPPKGGRVLVTKSPGYMLRVGEEELDANRFERLVEDGRRAMRGGDMDLAGRHFYRALRLWRGSALSDYTYEPFAQAAIARLEELKISAIQDRIEADLDLGHHGDFVGELDGLVKSYPMRERLRGQLMLARYRCGRQAEALEVARETRRALADELGIDPAPDLQELESAILNQDPALDLQRRPLESRPRGELSSDVPTTRYARNGAVALAYQVLGDGSIDLVFVPGFVSHLELNWELPSYVRLMERLATFTRLITVDRRGTGLSDPLSLSDKPSHETMVDDLLAVMDAAASERAAIFGFHEGGILGLLLAASHPERTSALVTYGTAAAGMTSVNYPWSWSFQEWESYLKDMADRWGTPDYADELLEWTCRRCTEMRAFGAGGRGTAGWL